MRAGSWKDHTTVCFVYQMPMPTVSVDILILLLSLDLNKVRQTLRVLPALLELVSSEADNILGQLAREGLSGML